MESRGTGFTLLHLGVGAICITASTCAGDQSTSEKFPTQPGVGNSQITGVPAGWSGGSAATNDYEIGRDIQIVHGGTTSAYLRSKNVVTAPNTFVTLTQGIRAENLRGKRVRYSAYLRVSDVTGEGLGLWFRTDPFSGPRSFDNMAGRRRTATLDWTHAEIVLDVPDNSVLVYFGALLGGPGMGWVDDIKIEIVDSTVALTAAPPPPVPIDSASIANTAQLLGTEPLNLDFEGVAFPETLASNVDWMKANSVTFATDDPAAADSDLEPLLAMLGNSSLVALGESTHGTREFFRMKHRVFRYLVERLGFDHFSIEASLPEALTVDHYVQTGHGDPAVLVRGMRFWTWSTLEVIDLVKWMREWNAAGRQPRLRFSGFDMQFPDIAMDSVVAFTRRISPALGDSVRASYQCLYARKLNGLVSQPGYQSQPPFEKDFCRTRIQSVDSLFARNLPEWSGSAGGDRTLLMQRLARLVSQWEDYARTGGIAERDRYMAENVAWWKARQAGNAGIMLWAHNAHVSRKAIWMGQHLGQEFGADYANIALTFSAGTFNAVFQNSNGTFGALQAHGLAGSWPQSIEAMFDATGRDRVLFDARSMKAPGTPGFVLRNRLTMRSIGSVFNPTATPSIYQAITMLPDDYDIVIWFRNASASRLSLSQ